MCRVYEGYRTHGTSTRLDWEGLNPDNERILLDMEHFLEEVPGRVNNTNTGQGKSLAQPYLSN